MKCLINLCLTGLLAAAPCSSPVFAGEVFRDNFDTPNGSLTDVGAWTQTGTNGTNQIQIADGEVQLASSGQDVYAGLASPVANAEGFGIKTSLDLNVSAAYSAGEYFLHLSDPLGSTTNFYERLFARSSAGGYQIGLLDTSGTGSTTTWGTQDLSFGTTYHVDVQWNFVTGNTNDTFSVVLNDVPYLNHTWTSATAEPLQLAAVNLRQGTAANAPSLWLNNLVVTTVPRLPAPFNIFQWEYVDSNDPIQGQRESTVLTVDGYGLHAQPGLQATGKNLTKAYLIGADLAGANFSSANLTNADLTQANLTGAHFVVATLTNADFTGAEVRGALFSGSNLTAVQFYSTASYQAHDLTGIHLNDDNFGSWNFASQNLTNGFFSGGGGADFTNAEVRGASLYGMTAAQLYSTASYQAHDLTGIQISSSNITGANFADQNLTEAKFGGTLGDANFSRANLTGAGLAGDLTGADFSQANLTDGGIGGNATGANFTQANLTNIFLSGDFTNANFSRANLTHAALFGSLFDANFRQANLNNASLSGVNLAGADLTGADVRGASFGRQTISECGKVRFGCMGWSYTDGGINLDQLYSTASFQAHDLSGIDLSDNGLIDANFAGFNLSNANLSGAPLTGADLSSADARGAVLYFMDAITTNLIQPNGHISGLNLGAGQVLAVRDYDGDLDPLYGTPLYGTNRSEIPITVDQHFAMGPGGTLRMLLEADAWNSTISFAAGISVILGGTLELRFADGTNVAGQIGRTFDLFDWTGVAPTGAFHVESPFTWNLTNLYTTGEVTLTAVPEPATLVLLIFAAAGLWVPRGRAT